MTSIVLNRMEIEEAGPNPKRLAEAIHYQLGLREGAVPVHGIARALDIQEIWEEPLHNLEAALLTTPERGYGAILLNRNSGTERRRYSVGHELLHFLNTWHEPTWPGGFQCSRQDMVENDKSARSLHRRQEAEANEFAIELLAPPARVASYIDSPAHLKHALAMAKDLDISREAAARRYVALHEEQLAVVFVIDGQLRYADLGTEFPKLSISKGQSIPFLPRYSGTGTLSDLEEVNPLDWLRRPEGVDLFAQLLRQRDGYAIILLNVQSDDSEDTGLEDVYDRVSRRGSRS